ncbi:hypothetical protein F511_20032 [Dorcoceras hygrometricum]|uniref:Uncharacterized protein n=1 Tax=Dorcoceras hygrometricum TaxID=472368 RepID=A0A2Z7B3Z5_9LAMI|nr:hypothetical protein F511_20032 [Dorcoceras hygrometricum]
MPPRVRRTAAARRRLPPEQRPRPETRVLRQPALEGLKNLARMETPRKDDRNKSDHDGGGTAARRGGAWRSGGGCEVEEGGGGARCGG